MCSVMVSTHSVAQQSLDGSDAWQAVSVRDSDDGLNWTGPTSVRMSSAVPATANVQRDSTPLGAPARTRSTVSRPVNPASGVRPTAPSQRDSTVLGAPTRSVLAAPFVDTAKMSDSKGRPATTRQARVAADAFLVQPVEVGSTQALDPIPAAADILAMPTPPDPQLVLPTPVGLPSQPLQPEFASVSEPTAADTARLQPPSLLEHGSVLRFEKRPEPTPAQPPEGPAPAHRIASVVDETTSVVPAKAESGELPSILVSQALDVGPADSEPETTKPVLTRPQTRCDDRLSACTQAWDEVNASRVQEISLDITPPFAPNERTREEAEQKKRETFANSPVRTWRDRDGRELVVGSMVDFRYGKLLVRDEHDEIRKIPYEELSLEDGCFLTDVWNVPTECPMKAGPYEPRSWELITFTWTASALCHKPLYFEDVALERYGHSAGPVKQTLLSGAHFFGNVFMLPYNVGLHPATECRYALGYYRPGSCAPWMLHALPISKRAIWYQTSAILAGVRIIP